MIKQSEIQSGKKSCQLLRREPPLGAREENDLSFFGKASEFLRIFRATALQLSLRDRTTSSAWVFPAAWTASFSIPFASGDASKSIDKRLRFINFLITPKNAPNH